jgi:protein SCO1/2
VKIMRTGIILPITLAFSLLACQQEREPQHFTARGTVKNIPADRKHVLISHEDIPGFMQAMTMEFAVKDPALLAGLNAGDDITFTIEQTSDSLYLIAIEQENEAAGRDEPQADPQPAEPQSTLPQANGGETEVVEAEFVPFPAPDFQLTDQDGQPFTLSSLHGKVVLMDFIFTQCPGPCPMLSTKFSHLQRRLGDRLGKEVMLLSVSIDPGHDTPEVLRAYAQRYRADPEGWKFLTGTTRDIIMVATHYGADYQRGPEGIIDHRLLTCVIDQNGMVVKEFTGVNHTVEDLLVETTKLLS